MKVIRGLVLFFLSAGILSGCSIKQQIEPYASAGDFELCIVEDTRVRPGFIVEYRRVLDLLGIQTKMLPSGSSIRDCPIVSTYTARWSWDFTIYMTYAEIKVYENGMLAGSALYDSRKGGARLDKWKDAETKIQELVQELFGRSS